MRSRVFLAATLLALCAGQAGAQAPNAVIVVGTVASAQNGSVTVKADNGKTETVKLAPDYIVVRNAPATLADIKPNDFVASAAVRAPDGKLHSTELRIFPEAMRGLGEGQHPMNDSRAQTMTNATVTGTAMVGASNTVKVRFPGGESELVVDPGVPVTRIESVDKSKVAVGAKVRMRAVPGADGLTARNVTLQ
jgi:hypothetical protein